MTEADIEVGEIDGLEPIFRVYHRPTGASVDIPRHEVIARYLGHRLSPEEIRAKALRLAHHILLKRLRDEATGAAATLPSGKG